MTAAHFPCRMVHAIQRDVTEATSGAGNQGLRHADFHTIGRQRSDAHTRVGVTQHVAGGIAQGACEPATNPPSAAAAAAMAETP